MKFFLSVLVLLQTALFFVFIINPGLFSSLYDFNARRICLLVICSLSVIYVVFHRDFWIELSPVNRALTVLALITFLLGLTYHLSINRLLFAAEYAFLLYMPVLFSIQYKIALRSKSLLILSERHGSLAFNLFLVYFLFVVLARYFLEFSLGQKSIHSVAGSFDNVRFMNHFVFFLSIIIMYLLVVKSFPSKQKIFYWITLFLLLFLTMQSYSRGFIFALLFGLLMPLVVLRIGLKVWWYVVWRMLLFLCFALMISNLVSYIYGHLTNLSIPREATFNRGASVTARIEMWKFVIQDCSRDWCLFPKGSGAFKENSPFSESHPHNSIIRILYELGVIGVCLYAVWFGLFLLLMLKIAEEKKRFFLGIAFFGGVAYSMVSGIFVMPAGQLMFVLLLGYILFVTNENLVLQFDRLSSIFFNLVPIVLFVVLIFAAIFSYQKVQMEPGVIHLLKDGPRFWRYY